MSDPANPISPQRFALALQDLPLSTLALKVAELRNSIAHLDYSNEQLRPFAYPSSSSPTPGGATTAGDPDCVDAIHENLLVIDRMNERIELVRAEVESRGCSWTEFSGLPNPSDPEATASALSKLIHGTLGNGVATSEAGANGDIEPEPHNGDSNGDRHANGVGGEGRHPAWTDRTFQTGRIGAGRVVMDSEGPATERQGGRLGDEELRRQMEERMRALEGADDEEGMHL